MSHFAQNRPHPMKSLKTFAFALPLLAALALTPLAQAREVSQLRVSAAEYGKTQNVNVGLNKSLLVDLPIEASEVIVSNPGIASAMMRTRTSAVIQGVGAGSTNIMFLDANGGRIAVVEIVVGNDSSSLTSTLAALLPGSSIQVQAFGQGVVLSGTALSQDDVQKAVTIATQFAGDPAKVANVINVSGGQQVMLKVTVAEVSRDTVKQLGINLNATLNSGALTTGLINSPGLGGASSTTPTGTLGVKLAAGPISIDATLRALERRGALRTLAEPTLTAISGQEAEFLAGGEFPVPTDVQDGKVTYTFKKFGVQLKFTPTVKSNGIVGLVVDTSVSEPTSEGSYSIAGVTIPATKERQAKTSVELPTGTTLAIGGLIQDQLRQQVNAFPGLGNIPILGALFRSRDFLHSQTELVILVTPYLAQATSNPPPLPTDNYVVAGDAEAVFLGHMEKLYGVGEGPAGMRGGFQGSVGFVLN
ncbi:type II and III secretion system protein family protein [Paradevosia shaoguanensis]|uniref:Type II and III secretion system protein family protein n=1 Tax=Paradevosia shaoguanensis TaxID=1335043 RepID=A0AA41QPD3_9HYPH|nr:type II and III secretion system protein family protein [Paradevosia shaoguanensis]MCF1744074.1 type II and III secretion system protein family protein [Paradevosia shaoguanensis]MCI0128557.1 type II and III secretion system protein family protein [Paradevosia shaoguanensis]